MNCDMREYTISTFKRYVYINIYAFLILIMGIGILFIPFSYICSYIIYFQVILSLFCFKSAISILKTWKSKKRRYKKLIDENIVFFNPESFEEYMKAPCGRLLVKIVLKDLGKQEQYRKLKVYNISWGKTLKSNCRTNKTVKTVVYKKDA